MNESIQRTRGLMEQMKGFTNKETAVMNLLQSNPQLQSLIPMLRNGASLEAIAKQMAQASGNDINDIIRQLSGGM